MGREHKLIGREKYKRELTQTINDMNKKKVDRR